MNDRDDLQRACDADVVAEPLEDRYGLLGLESTAPRPTARRRVDDEPSPLDVHSRGETLVAGSSAAWPACSSSVSASASRTNAASASTSVSEDLDPLAALRGEEDGRAAEEVGRRTEVAAAVRARPAAASLARCSLAEHAGLVVVAPSSAR